MERARRGTGAKKNMHAGVLVSAMHQTLGDRQTDRQTGRQKDGRGGGGRRGDRVQDESPSTVSGTDIPHPPRIKIQLLSFLKMDN